MAMTALARQFQTQERLDRNRIQTNLPAGAPSHETDKEPIAPTERQSEVTPATAEPLVWRAHW